MTPQDLVKLVSFIAQPPPNKPPVATVKLLSIAALLSILTIVTIVNFIFNLRDLVLMKRVPATNHPTLVALLPMTIARKVHIVIQLSTGDLVPRDGGLAIATINISRVAFVVVIIPNRHQLQILTYLLVLRH